MTEFEALLSQTASYQSKWPIGEASIDYFVRAIGDDAAIYSDPAAARAAGYGGIIAPPTFVCETAQYSNRAPDKNGYIGHAWDLQAEGWRRIRGGNAYRFHQPVVATDIIRVDWRVDSIRETTDSGGRKIVIVVSEARYSNQNGELLAENSETIIYRRDP
jgi:acyl dehydratase